MNLDQIKLAAQRDANRTGKQVAVLNLNSPAGLRPIYVIRDWDARFEERRGLVWIAYPGTVDQGG